MAKRSTRRRASRGGYNFTYRRKAALYRAAKISAEKRRKRRIKTAAVTVGAIAGIGAGAYLGHRYGPQAVAGVRNFKPQLARARNAVGMRIIADPAHKEKVRVATSISAAPPSAPNLMHTSAPIPEAARAAAAETRAAIEQEKLPPHLGGPDNRIYTESGEVDTQAMTDRSVANTRTNRAKHHNVVKNVFGSQTESYTGTPGGTRTPPQAQRDASVEQAYWDSLLGTTGSRPAVPVIAKGVVGTAAKNATTGTPTKSKVKAKASDTHYAEGSKVFWEVGHSGNKTRFGGTVVGAGKFNRPIVRVYDPISRKVQEIEVPHKRIIPG